jgi:hypothetical protein
MRCEGAIVTEETTYIFGTGRGFLSEGALSVYFSSITLSHLPKWVSSQRSVGEVYDLIK